MIKNPVFLFASLIIVAVIVVVFYKVGTNPFVNYSQSTKQTASTNPHESDPAINYYAKNCAACHGKFGEGMGGHPSLQTTALTIEEIKQIIKNGQGEMPAFSGLQEPNLTQLAQLVKQFSSK